MSTQFRIAIFASGGGSNAEAIISHFKDVKWADVVLIVSNNKKAGVLERANRLGIKAYVHDRAAVTNEKLVHLMEKEKIDFIVLAGYMRKINPDLIQAYPNAIVNIHPALLPKFGGKGMYGMHVHEAVVKEGEKVSGPTIHFVNENYDEGSIIAQFTCEVDPTDTAADVQKKVLKLEHQHYPVVIEQILKERNGI